MEQNGRQMYLKLQENLYTDCSFILNNDDHTTSETIHAHKLILCAIPYFETNFKEEWSKNQPIPINICTSSIFKKFLKAIYTHEIEKDIGIDEACALYEVAHFYQTDAIKRQARDTLIDLLDVFSAKVSRAIDLAWKYREVKIICHICNFFASNAKSILRSKEFLNCTPEAVNFLYQAMSIDADNNDLLWALEKYTNANNAVTLEKLKPAIGSIDFVDISNADYIRDTPLLNDNEKKDILRHGSFKIF